MAGSGEVYRRRDGQWAWRIKAANAQVVATDSGQGYESKTHARSTLQKVISGHYNGPIKDLEKPASVVVPSASRRGDASGIHVGSGL